MEPREIWKDIPGHKGEYQVSNMGRRKITTTEVQEIKTLCLAGCSASMLAYGYSVSRSAVYAIKFGKYYRD